MVLRSYKFIAYCLKTQFRELSSKAKSKHYMKPGIYVSSCFDVHYNLAFETWVYENVLLKDNEEICFLWRNDPCIVIGRHQNPWTECRVLDTYQYGVKLARRASGGGTVYHDRGNINITFFTSRQRHNRKRNLAFIVDTLKNAYHLPLSLNDRDDIIFEQKFKVSGTAAKLGSTVAYHHCTLLVDANVDLMRSLLSSTMMGVDSKATESVRSHVTTLIAANATLRPDFVMDTIASHYASDISTNKEITYVDPTKIASFSEIQLYHQELKSWEWIFGKTPNFKITRSASHDSTMIELKLVVEKGCIQKISVQAIIDQINNSAIGSELSELLTKTFFNERFWPSSIAVLLTSLKPLHTNDIIDKLLTECFDDLFH